MSAGKYRLVTRSDFDGLVCAAIMRELGMIDEIKFVHPKDMQDGVIEITNRDITTNLPYVEGVHLAFDHHASETIRVVSSIAWISSISIPCLLRSTSTETIRNRSTKGSTTSSREQLKVN